MGENQGVIESETHRVPAEKWTEREKHRERERERERVRERDGGTERPRERNGVGIMCGETPRELETLEREI